MHKVLLKDAAWRQGTRIASVLPVRSAFAFSRCFASDSSTEPRSASIRKDSDPIISLLDKKDASASAPSSSEPEFRQQSISRSGPARSKGMLDIFNLGSRTPPVPSSRRNNRAANIQIPNNGKLVVGLTLYCRFTRNNIILTLTQRFRRVGKLAKDLDDQQKILELIRPPQEILLSISSGQLGFKGSKKSSYEASFQCTARMFQQLHQRGLTGHKMELVFRDFGEGREAFINALNGQEGAKIRPMVERVTDRTRIKFGGDRAPGKRRV